MGYWMEHHQNLDKQHHCQDKLHSLGGNYHSYFGTNPIQLQLFQNLEPLDYFHSSPYQELNKEGCQGMPYLQPFLSPLHPQHSGKIVYSLLRQFLV